MAKRVKISLPKKTMKKPSKKEIRKAVDQLFDKKIVRPGTPIEKALGQIVDFTSGQGTVQSYVVAWDNYVAVVKDDDDQGSG